MLIMWETVDMSGTEELLKQWKNKATMLSCGHHGVVWWSDSTTEVSVTVVPFQSELCTFHCIICFTSEVGKDGKGIMV